MPICAYCKEEKQLCWSHAIPDGIFRQYKEWEKSGQLYNIPLSDNRPIHKSQETGKGKLLCRECERDFNKRFDKMFVNTMKDWVTMFLEEGVGCKYTCNPNHFAQSLASIFWRTCLIKNNLWSSVKFTIQHKNQLLSIIKGKREDVLKKCSVQIKRFYDTNYDFSNHKEGFSPKAISTILVPVYENPLYLEKSIIYHSFNVCIFGFHLSMILPSLPFYKEDFLHPKNKIINAMPANIRNYEWFQNSRQKFYEKLKNKNTTLRN